jgi:L-gulono-1,4-lactone dehydrogenase
MNGQQPIGVPRVKWKNYVNDQQSDPLEYFSPSTLEELREIVIGAETKGYHVKAIGSGHSSSDIAISRDYMVNTHGLNSILNKDTLSFREGVNSENLFFVQCGIILKDLINELDMRGKALINMGAYTGQTIAGVISTSTHGSGISLDAFPGYVKAIIMVGENGKLYHIERSGEKAISKAAVFIPGFKNIEFITDDICFNAVAVSMGCMGIIYAVVIEVTNSYWLEEKRTFCEWSKIKAQLKNGSLLKEYRHVEVLVNPYPKKDGEHHCLLTLRREPPPDKQKRTYKKGHRKFLYQLSLDILPACFFDWLMRTIINHFPSLIPWMAGFLLESLTDRDYIDKSFKVLDLGKANNLAAFATEIAFPKDSYIAAVDELIAIVKKSIADGKQYLAVPFSLRFVRANDIFLSMQYSENENEYVCMIEFPTVSQTIGGLEMLARIESAMYQSKFKGVPHWGQINHVGGTRETSLGKLYPCFPQWLQVYQRFCKKGTFQNDFTKRCGIECIAPSIL